MERLLTIKRIKGFGFTLNETMEFLEKVAANTASCENVSIKVAQKVSVIEARIKELEKMKQLMLAELTNCQKCFPPETEVCPMLIPNLI